MGVLTRPLASDPLRNFKFNVVIPRNDNSTGGSGNGSPSSGQSMAKLGFMSVSGLGSTIEPLTYREGGDNVTALPLDSLVLTTSGWKPMGEIEVGDRVVDPYGEDSKVVDLLPVVTKDTYRVRLGDSSEAVACWGHLWEVEVRDSNNRLTTKVLSTLEVKELVDKRFSDGSAHFHVRVPRNQPMRFDVAPELPIDPYLLGILLSEGSLEVDGVSFAQEELNEGVIDRCRRALPEGHFLRPEYQDGQVVSWAISVGNDGPGVRNVNGRNQILQAVRELGLLGHRAWEKFIPEVYKRADIKDRVALLQGIMDGDGWVDRRHCTQFSSSSETLARDVRDLICTLGGRCGRLRCSTGRSYLYRGERRVARDAWQFSGISDLPFVPFTIPRKVADFALSSKTSSQFRRIVSVEFEKAQPVRCLEVSASSHLFVTGDFIPSHNTRKMPGQADFNPITLSRGLFATDSHNWDWFTQLFTAQYGGSTTPPTTDFRVTVFIGVLDHPYAKTPAGGLGPQYEFTYPQQSNIVKICFALYSAWIGSLAYSDFDAGGNAVAVEQMTLNYEGFDMWWAGTGHAPNNIYNASTWQSKTD